MTEPNNVRIDVAIVGEMKEGSSLNLDIANKMVTRKSSYGWDSYLFGEKLLPQILGESAKAEECKAGNSILNYCESQ